MKNENWFAGDSPWKAAKVYQIIKSNALDNKIGNVAEIGCGAGLILAKEQNVGSK